MTRKLFFFFMILFALSSYAQTAEINVLRCEFDVNSGNEYGMKIHAKLIVNNAQNDRIMLYGILYDNNGNNMYSTASGYHISNTYELTTNEIIVTAPYQSTRWDDLVLFVPYGAIPHYSGKNNYKYILYALHLPTKKFIGKSASNNFNVTYSKSNVSNTRWFASQKSRSLEDELKTRNSTSYRSKTSNTVVHPNDPCGGKGYTLCQVCNGSGSLMSGNYLTGYFTTSCYNCFGSGKFECPFCKGKKDMETLLDNLNRMTPEERENYLRMQQIQLQQNQQFINSIHQNNEEYRQEVREIDRRTNQKLREINSSCSACYGTGNCNICHGSGVVSNLYTSGNSLCSACWSGHPGKCSRCKGTGRVY